MAAGRRMQRRGISPAIGRKVLACRPEPAARSRTARAYRDGSACRIELRRRRSSTIRPRYMMATRSETWRTTPRSWLMKIAVRSRSRRRSMNRLSTCAWIETSSEATGSSSTSRSGFIASARAMAMRWRCPPENWCGKAAAIGRIEPDAGQHIGDIGIGGVARVDELCATGPSATVSPMRMRGSRLENGSWCTIWTRVVSFSAPAAAHCATGLLEQHLAVARRIDARDHPPERGLAAAGFAARGRRLRPCSTLRLTSVTARTISVRSGRRRTGWRSRSPRLRVLYEAL